MCKKLKNNRFKSQVQELFLGSGIPDPKSFVRKENIIELYVISPLKKMSVLCNDIKNGGPHKKNSRHLIIQPKKPC
jgi:hypothetical protein